MAAGRSARLFRGGAGGAVLVACLAIGLRPAGAWDIEWIDTSGAITDDVMLSVDTDSTGAYAAGGLRGALPGHVSAGGIDAFVRKIRPDGSEVWARQFGTKTTDRSFETVVDGTGVYVMGYTLGSLGGPSAGDFDVFVRKYDLDGALLWTRQFGTPRLDWPHAMAVHSTGIYISGATLGTFPGQPTGSGDDTFVGKLDATDGTITWLRQFGERGSLITAIGGIDADDTGVYVVSNRLASPARIALFRKLDHDGNALWAADDVGNDDCGMSLWDVSAHAGKVYVVGQGRSDYLITGTCEQSNYDTGLGVLRQYSSDGAPGWKRIIQAGPKTQLSVQLFTGAKNVTATASGVYVAANATTHFAGHLERQPNNHRECDGLGYTGEMTWFDMLDAYVRRYDDAGNVIWTHQFGSDLFDIVQGVAARDGAVYVAAESSCDFEDRFEFDGGPRDGYVMRTRVDPVSVSGRIQLVIGKLETLWDASEIVAPGDFNSLASHLEAALGQLEQGNSHAAENALGAFIDGVEELELAARLDPGVADDLYAAAYALIDAI